MADTLQGSFVPTTSVWDVNEINSVDVTSPAFKELLVRLYQNINLIATVLNDRDSGYYPTLEFVNGQRWFPDPALNSSSTLQPTYRQVVRKVIDFGALPNGGVSVTKSVAHGITVNPSYRFTRIYGTASLPTAGSYSYIPLPFASPTANRNIELFADATNVTITVNAAINWSTYTTSYIVLEYLKF